MELDQLFAVKDFPTAKITIPCFDSQGGETPSSDNHHHPGGSDNAPQHQQEQEASSNNKKDSDPRQDGEESCSSSSKMIHLEIGSSSSASTDFDLTGQVLWPISLLLGHYLASTAVQRHLSSSNGIVVELGAGGTGVPGLVAAHAPPRQVVLTDGNASVLPLLQDNVERHSFGGGGDVPVVQVSCQELIWGDRMQLQNLRDQLLGPVSMVVAADVVQWPSVLEPLLWTVQALLFRRPPNKEDNSCDGGGAGVFVLGLVTRAESTVSLFFQLAKSLGFSWRRIPRRDYLVDGQLPGSCHERGGPLDLYELKLKEESSTVVPFLWQVDEQDQRDTTLGTSYEHTLSHPC